MQKLSEFLEFGSIDTKLYWRIPDQTGKEMFEVQWRKDHGKPWRFRQVGDIFWQIAKGDAIGELLISAGVDVDALEAKVKYSTLQQVAFAQKIIDDARQAFGKEEVDKAIYENQLFLKQLEEAVQRIAKTGKVQPKPARPLLKIIKNSQDSPKILASLSI